MFRLLVKRGPEGYTPKLKRFHLHVSIENLDQSINFRSTLFAPQPALRQMDSAKWMLEDPRMNFAISVNHQPVGVNYLGFQVDTDKDLRGMHAQLQAADARLTLEDEQACCYAQSDKYWVTESIEAGLSEAVRSIYQAGIATGHATFAAAPPASWEAWSRDHLNDLNVVAIEGSTVCGWASLAVVSGPLRVSGCRRGQRVYSAGGGRPGRRHPSIRRPHR